MVISVPHSGTRTLQRHILTMRGSGSEVVKHWHWHLHWPLIQDFFCNTSPGESRAHIPLRNPLDITDSWERRYGDATDKTQVHVNEMIAQQAAYVVDFENMVTVYRIEDVPLLLGQGPRPDGWPPREDLLKLPRMQELWLFMNQNTFVSDFYREYYSDSELWWM